MSMTSLMMALRELVVGHTTPSYESKFPNAVSEFPDRVLRYKALAMPRPGLRPDLRSDLKSGLKSGLSLGWGLAWDLTRICIRGGSVAQALSSIGTSKAQVIANRVCLY